MNYKLLTPDEWDRAKPLFNGNDQPHPETSVIAIAENDDGEIKGLLVLQLQWHMEPLVLTNPNVSFLALKRVLDNQLDSSGGGCYYAHIDTDKVGKMAEKAGMKLQPSLIFKGEV